MTKYDYTEALALEAENSFDYTAISEWPSFEYGLQPVGDAWETNEIIDCKVYVFVNEETVDCYTVLIETVIDPINYVDSCYIAMSQNPLAPNGVNMVVTAEYGLHLGRPLDSTEADALPDDVKTAIRQRVSQFDDKYAVVIIYE